MEILGFVKELGLGSAIALFCLALFMLNKLWCACFDPIWLWQLGFTGSSSDGDGDSGSDGGGD